MVLFLRFPDLSPSVPATVLSPCQVLECKCHEGRSAEFSTYPKAEQGQQAPDQMCRCHFSPRCDARCPSRRYTAVVRSAHLVRQDFFPGDEALRH